MILSSDSFNCVALAADCKYKWSVVDPFILFHSTLIIFFQLKTTLSTKQELSPEHQPKFVWLRGIFGGGWNPSTICMCTSLPCDNGTIPMRCFLDWYTMFVMLRRTNIGYWWLVAYCSIDIKSNWFPLFWLQCYSHVSGGNN